MVDTRLRRFIRPCVRANLGELDKAAQSCREAIKINLFHAEPYHLLALAAQEHGDTAEAKNLLKQAVYLGPAFIAAWLELGEIYARENDAPPPIAFLKPCRPMRRLRLWVRQRQAKYCFIWKTKLE